MALITCKDLTLGYENTRVAEHLSFTVEEGDYLCIVGENGSGKSTLMKTLLGLRAPLAGTIAFSDGLHKNEIGYLPQQTPLQRDFPASVQEVVVSGCLSRCGLRPFFSRMRRPCSFFFPLFKAHLWAIPAQPSKTATRSSRITRSALPS